MLTAGFLGCALQAEAGLLELKNGTTPDGKYVGGSAGSVRFETSAGVQVVETAQAIALSFTAPAATPSAAANPSPAPAAAAQPTAVTLRPTQE